MRILVAEDDAMLAAFLTQRLQEQHFFVQIAPDGPEAQRMARDQGYDLVLLDIGLPGKAGLDVLRDLRSHKPDLPVVMMAGANTVEERVRALDAGADDYLAKPFDFAELAARIRAVLRRGKHLAPALLRVENLEMDRMTREVHRGEQSIPLSPKEFTLLEYLMLHAGHPVARSTIIEQVWKLHLHNLTNIVDVYINYLRRKVDTDAGHALIRTVRGTGYQIGATIAQNKRNGVPG
ncbi:MAG: response regulator transcription factor [Candidatus Acidiferrum sp.]